MPELSEEDFAEACLDTVHEWLRYFYDKDLQWKADRIDASDVSGVAVFRVRPTNHEGREQEFEVTITAKEL